MRPYGASPTQALAGRELVRPLPMIGGIPIERAESPWHEPLVKDRLDPDVLERLRERAGELAQKGFAAFEQENAQGEPSRESDSEPGEAPRIDVSA